MTTTYLLRTRGDPLQAVRGFLAGLWSTAGLAALYGPAASGGAAAPEPQWVLAPDRLQEMDPFAPVMLRNGASEVARRSRSEPGRPIAALLRPCEVRAFHALEERGEARSESLLLIGMDCLATFPRREFDRRAASGEEARKMTREALRFARQGGILMYRDRSACQICPSPLPEGVPLSIGVLGLSARQGVLVTSADEVTADRLGLQHLTDGPAPANLARAHDRMREAAIQRRARARERTQHALREVPDSLQALVAHMRACRPCSECLEACAIYAGELTPWTASDSELASQIAHWVEACAGCGMCEQACPREVPLAAVIGRLRDRLRTEPQACLL